MNRIQLEAATNRDKSLVPEGYELP